MPLTQPGAASTTPTRRPSRLRLVTLKRAPEFNELHHGGKLIWVYCAVNRDIDAQILWNMSVREKNPTRSTALVMGYSALRDDASRCIREARDAGQLLFCWAGTTLLEVPA
jgi:hypothetical protein